MLPNYLLINSGYQLSPFPPQCNLRGLTALSNVYSDQGALYDVSLNHCPDLLMDYDLIQTARNACW